MKEFFYMLGAMIAYSPAIISILIIRFTGNRLVAAGVGFTMYAVIISFFIWAGSLHGHR